MGSLNFNNCIAIWTAFGGKGGMNYPSVIVPNWIELPAENFVTSSVTLQKPFVNENMRVCKYGTTLGLVYYEKNGNNYKVFGGILQASKTKPAYILYQRPLSPGVATNELPYAGSGTFGGDIFGILGSYLKSSGGYSYSKAQFNYTTSSVISLNTSYWTNSTAYHANNKIDLTKMQAIGSVGLVAVKERVIIYAPYEATADGYGYAVRWLADANGSFSTLTMTTNFVPKFYDAEGNRETPYYQYASRATQYINILSSAVENTTDKTLPIYVLWQFKDANGVYSKIIYTTVDGDRFDYYARAEDLVRDALGNIWHKHNDEWHPNNAELKELYREPPTLVIDGEPVWMVDGCIMNQSDFVKKTVHADDVRDYMYLKTTTFNRIYRVFDVDGRNSVLHYADLA